MSSRVHHRRLSAGEPLAEKTRARAARRFERGGTSPTLLNAWTHLAATYDRTTLRLYVNGTQVSTRAVTGNITTSTGALRIGGNSSWTNEWFSGLIDEVRVYNRTLTATEIQADMARPVSGA